MNHHNLICSFLLVLGLLAAPLASAQTEAAEPFVMRISTEVLDAANADASIQRGDREKIIALVDAKVVPFIDFERITASAVGRYWRDASPEQQQGLQDEFKTLLIRAYAGALAEAKDRAIVLKPRRGSAADKEVVVRTEIRGKGEPIQLDYRVESAGTGWKIYDMSVLGVWLVENYRSRFAQEISAGGIDGLIAFLTGLNKGAAKS